MQYYTRHSSWLLLAYWICVLSDNFTDYRSFTNRTVVMSLKSLNAKYLGYLAAAPLLTKSITAGCFSGLNEIISSTITNDFAEVTIAGVKVKHFLTPKLLTMIIYGSLIATPISHNLYAVINKIFKAPLSPAQKLLQILTSLSTVTPILAGCFTAWIALINNYKPTGASACEELKRAFRIAKYALTHNYLPILRSSLVTSSVSLVIAQKFVRPELWVVFFNFVYFVLGTYQNTKLKKIQKLQRAQKQNEVEKQDGEEKQQDEKKQEWREFVCN